MPDSISLLNGADITTSVIGTGDAGTIGLQSSESITLGGLANNKVELSSSALSANSGYAGAIGLSSPEISANHASISTTTFSERAEFFNDMNVNGVIDLTANSLLSLSNSGISSSTFGTSNAGQIRLFSEHISIENSTLESASNATSDVAGRAGMMNFDAHIFEASDSLVSTQTLSNAEDDPFQAPSQITLWTFDNDDSSVVFDNVSLVSGTEGSRNASTINIIDAANLDIKNSIIQMSTSNTGDAGDFYILDAGSVSITNTHFTSASTGTNSGDGGTITLAGNSFTGTDSSFTLSTESNDVDSEGGSVSIGAASGGVLLSNVRFFSTTSGLANAGAVGVSAETSLVKLDKVSIQANTTSGGEAGDVYAHASSLEITDSDFSVESNAVNSKGGGRILLSANGISISDSSLSASSKSDIDFTTPEIEIDAQDSDLYLTNSTIKTTTTGDAQAGHISLYGHNYIQSGGLVEAVSGEFTDGLLQSGTGEAGYININGGHSNQFELENFTLKDGGDIRALSLGEGLAGHIYIANTGKFEMSGLSGNRAEISTSAVSPLSDTQGSLSFSGTSISIDNALISTDSASNQVGLGSSIVLSSVVLALISLEAISLKPACSNISTSADFFK